MRRGVSWIDWLMPEGRPQRITKTNIGARPFQSVPYTATSGLDDVIDAAWERAKKEDPLLYSLEAYAQGAGLWSRRDRMSPGIVSRYLQQYKEDPSKLPPKIRKAIDEWELENQRATKKPRTDDYEMTGTPSVPPATRSFFKMPMYTTGKYQGRIRRLGRKRVNVYEKYGSSQHNEKVVNADGANCAVLGHSSCLFSRQMDALGRALLRVLLSQCQEFIYDWTANAAHDDNEYEYRIEYNTDPLIGTVTTASGNLQVGGAPAAITYIVLARQLINKFYAIVTTANDNIRWQKLQLIVNPSGGITWNKEIDLTQSKFRLSCVSVMTLQNITPSATGVNDSHDVRANPIICRVYQTRSNSFIEKDKGGALTVSDYGSGEIPGGTSSLTHIHEPTFYSNAKKVGGFILEPGAIKKSTLKTKGTFRFNHFMGLLKRYLAVNTTVDGTQTAAHVYFGVSRLFEFEHMNKSSSDPNVSVTGEINCFTSGYIRYRINRSSNRILG